MRSEKEDPLQHHALHSSERPPDARSIQDDTTEPDEQGGDIAKDVNVVRGDDRPQSVRHSG